MRNLQHFSYTYFSIYVSFALTAPEERLADFNGLKVGGFAGPFEDGHYKARLVGIAGLHAKVSRKAESDVSSCEIGPERACALWCR